MNGNSTTEGALRAENAELRARLDEAEEILRAIRAGDVDALVAEGDAGPQLYTLQGLDAESNRFRGEMLAQVSDAVIAIDLEERVTFLNAAAERQYRVRAGDVLGRKLSEIYTRHWPSPEAEAATWAALRERGEWRGETIQRTHDGRELHVESSVTTLRGPDGAANGMVAAIRDITARKQAETALRESERFVSSVAAASPHLIYVFDLERMGVTYVSRPFLGELGYPVEVAERVTRLDAFRDYMEPEEMPHLSRLLDEWRTLPEGHLRHDEYRLRHADGTIRSFAGRELAFARRPDGSVRQIIGSLVDITERKRAEELLLASEKKFRAMLESAPDAMVIVNRQSVIVLANAQTQQVFGYRSEELLGQRVEMLMPGLFRARHAGHVQNFFSAPHIRVIGAGLELLGQRKDGSEFPIEISLGPLEIGDETLASAAIRDITVRKQSEVAMEHSRASLQAVLETAPVGVVFADASGNITLANDALKEILGGPVTGDAHGPRGGYRLCHLDGSEIGPRELPLPSALQDGVISRDVEILVKRDDGSEVVALAAATPLRGADGKILGATAILQDITARKRTESVLRASEAVFRATFENAAVGIAHVARDGRLLKVNDKFCQLVGYSSQQLVTKTFQEITYPDDVDSNQALLRQLLSGQIQSYEMDKRYIRNDGSIVWAHLTVAPVRDPRTHEPDYVVSVVEDITDRKAAEEQVRRLNAELEARVTQRTAELLDANRQLTGRSKQLRRLALELSHAEERERRRIAQVLHDHLQQTLYASRLQAALIVEENDLAAVHAIAARATRLIDEATAIAGSLTVELSPPLLHDAGLVDSLRWLGDWMEQNHGLTVQVTSSAQINPDTEGISVLLFQCTRELLFNVIKHSDVKAAHVTVEKIEDQARVTVSDHGRGFDADGHRTGPQAGFGLFSIRERLRLVGGSMDIDSAPGSGGTRVTLQAPFPQFCERRV